MKSILLCGAAATALLLPTATLAAGQDPIKTFATPTPDEGASDGPDVVAEVIVTALRRETRLQDTPVAISVMNSETLADRHVESLLDLADGAVPSLRVATFEARRSALTIGIRGIVPLDANQPAREQGVGVYIDGVYMGRQHGLDAALLDVERIEVLRGPQGTLFGRNAEGGALNIVTRRPSGVFDLRATAGIGNYGAYNTDLHMNLPAMGDFAVKVDGVIQHRDATTENPMAGQTGWNFYDRRGLRVQGRWTPTQDLTVDLTYDRFHSEDTPYYSQLVSYNPLGRPVGTGAGQIRPLPPIVVAAGGTRMEVADIMVPQQPSVGDQSGYALNLNYDINDNLQFRSITAYRDLVQTQWDNSGGAHRPPTFSPNGNFSRYSLADLWQHQFSQEFQLIGSSDRFDWVAGLFYFNETAADDAATPNTNRWDATGTGYTFLDPTPTLPGFRVLDRASEAHAESWAAYGQVVWTPPILEDRLHITLGGRYTSDDKNGRLFIVNNAPTSLTFEESNNRFNPLVTVAYEVSDDINLYATYATGYRAGGASSRSLTYRSFGPEDVVSYEVGMKADFWDHRARLNVAAFAMDRDGSQIDFSALFVIGSTNRNTLETINAPGTTEIRGLELEGFVSPIEGLTFTASYAYTETNVPPTLNPFTGLIQPVYIVFTPRNAGMIGMDWSRPAFGDAELRVHLDANYADATQTFDQEGVTNDSRTLVNGRISLADIPLRQSGGLLTVSAWARNVFDIDYIYRRSEANRASIGDYANFGDPRTFGVEATVRF